MPLPTAEETIGYLDSLSNWGRWGDDDRLGTLNLITPEKRKHAASLIESGEIVSLSRDIDPANADPLHSGLSSTKRFMQIGEASHYLGNSVRFDGVTEFVGIEAHGSNTHLDGLAHYSWDGKNYNGFDVAENTTSIAGATKLSVHQASDGIVTRGVLLDIAGLHNVPWLDAGYAVTPADLLAAEKKQGVIVSEGDALIVHTGHVARVIAEGPVFSKDNPLLQLQAGLSAECLPFLHERDICVIGSDCIQDVQPSGFTTMDLIRPIHTVGLVALGLWLIDNMELTELAEKCANLNRWEFFFTMLPWRMVGVTSSATNPVALF
ncbi:cyclase family protein [Rhodococcus erythropolis]|uniref:Cyclase family protein n=1 Tax=Rhodococcus erythropolis TaxID=1833 RepID=A0AAX3ZXF8_RHOER|nr:cyclase family protein [Rhodococcus erythropolis]WMN01752.1 cyclase family protein [Rhodococcus erythropolis]